MLKKLFGSIKEAINPPRYLVNQPNTSIERRTIRTKIAGVTHENRQKYLAKCYPGQGLIITNKPIANYPHAMAIYAVEKNKRIMIGHLSDDLAQEIYEVYWTGNELLGKILDVTGGTRDKPSMGCNIEFYVA